MTKLFIGKVIKVIKGGKCILNDISFEVEDRQFTSIIGPSGSGKTTLLNTLLGIESISSGELFYKDKLASNKDKSHDPSKLNFGVVFQSLNLFPHLSVRENILYGISKWDALEKTERLNSLVDMVDLGHCVDMPIQSLSGGEKQRVAIARSLAPRPKVLFLDEPFSNLDEKLRIELRESLKNIFRQENISVFLITHDKDDAFYLSDKVMVLNNGKIAQFNKPQILCDSPSSIFVADFVDAGFCLGNKFFKRRDLSFEEKQSGKDYILEVIVLDSFFSAGLYHYECQYESNRFVFSSHRIIEKGASVGVALTDPNYTPVALE